MWGSNLQYFTNSIFDILWFLTLGNIQLHRLSWQKVWQVSLTLRGDPAVPEFMAWHPEGLFLIVSSGKQI